VNVTSFSFPPFSSAARSFCSRCIDDVTAGQVPLHRVKMNDPTHTLPRRSLSVTVAPPRSVSENAPTG
jgi:hypothetical protein